MAIIPIGYVTDHKLLPIDSQDIVTKVRLVIAGTLAGEEPSTLQVWSIFDTPESAASASYVASPITFVYEAPEHAVYGAERSMAVLTADPFLPPTSPLIPEPTFDSVWSNPGSPSAVRDGDPITHATPSGGAGIGRITYGHAPGLPWVGFRLVYERTANPSITPPYAAVGYGRRWPGGVSRIRTQYWKGPGLLDTSSASGATESYAIVPPDARFEQLNNADVFDESLQTEVALTAVGGDALKVYAFYPLALDVARLEDIAKSNIRLPASTPRRVTVAGYVPPDREHTIVGWPGGDYTARVEQHQYDFQGGEVLTIIDFEEAGPPLGVPAEAVEAERVRVARTAASIDRAAYGLKMGERQ